MKMRLKPYLTGLFTLLFLAGCGLKGSLYQTPEQPNTPSEEQSEQH
ncbi:lipoprotein [Thalassotalea euphylliae]